MTQNILTSSVYFLSVFYSLHCVQMCFSIFLKRVSGVRVTEARSPCLPRCPHCGRAAKLLKASATRLHSELLATAAMTTGPVLAMVGKNDKHMIVRDVAIKNIRSIWAERRQNTDNLHVHDLKRPFAQAWCL